MNEVVISTNPDRAARERVLEVLKAQNGPNAATNFIVQPAALRVENVITAATNYKFDLFEQLSGQTATEIKLNRNDAFFVTHIGLLLAKEITGPTPVPLANTRLFSHPGVITFPAAGEVAALEAFYNAQMTFKTVPVERIQKFDTNVFRYQPPTRVATIDGDTWGPDLAHMGYYRLSGEIILDGSQDNDIQISLAAGANTAAAVGITNESNILIVKLFGHLVINGAQKVGVFLN